MHCTLVHPREIMHYLYARRYPFVCQGILNNKVLECLLCQGGTHSSPNLAFQQIKFYKNSCDMHSFEERRDLEDERVRKGTCHQWEREQFGNREARLPWYLQSWPRHSLSQLRSPGQPCPSPEIACHPALQHPLEHPASHGHPVCCKPALPASLSTYRWSKHCISLWWCIENLRSIRLPKKNPIKMLVTTTSMCVYEYEGFWVDDVNFKSGKFFTHKIQSFTCWRGPTCPHWVGPQA